MAAAAERPAAQALFPARKESFPSTRRATATAAFDRYISDPAHPVPYRHQPIQPTYPGGGWPTWLVEDQRFVRAIGPTF